MKRIMNDVAVQTLLYTMCPQSEVVIFDCPEYIIPVGDPVSQFAGTTYSVDEILHNYKFVKIAKAKIRRTDISDGRLFLMIDTRQETY